MGTGDTGMIQHLSDSIARPMAQTLKCTYHVPPIAERICNVRSEYAMIRNMEGSSSNYCIITHQTPELNPSAQRCLMRFFLLGMLLLEPCI
jgi:hypothetical protein